MSLRESKSPRFTVAKLTEIPQLYKVDLLKWRIICRSKIIFLQWLKIALNDKRLQTKCYCLCRRINANNAKHKTLVNKHTILTTCKVQNANSTVTIRVKTTAENGRCVQCEGKCQISEKLAMSATECFSHFDDAMANSLRHPVINYCSNALQIKAVA